MLPPSQGTNHHAELPKHELTVVLQRIIGRTLTKQDVLYETQQVEGGWQSTVKLLCLNGEEYVGEPCENEKAAEHAAAQQALLVNADTVANLPPPNSNRRRKAKKAEGGSTSLDALMMGAPEPATGSNSKTDLVIRLQAHCGRTMTKQDVVYNTMDLSGMFQSTVKLACLLPPPDFHGQPRETEKDAEKSAAEAALADQVSWTPAGPPPPALPVASSAGKGKARKGQAGKPQAQQQAVVMQPGQDHKSELMALLQKIVHRALTKGDVEYSIVEHEGSYQATVRLVCLGGRQYTGTAGSSKKVAEHLAAQRAVADCAKQAMHAGAPPAKRARKAAPGSAPMQPQAVRAPAAGGGEPLGYLPNGQPLYG